MVRSDDVQTLAELPFVGGDPALDFTNTAELRGHPRCGDVLHSPDDLRTWGVRYGLLEPGARAEDPEAELAVALQARELLYRLWLTRVCGNGDGDDDPQDLARLARFAADAQADGTLAPAGDGCLGWRWDSGRLSTVRHVAVSCAVDLLTAPAGTRRLKQCPGDHCGWFFLDATKRGNRRWCEMRGCGQEAKTENRRRRRAA